MRHPRETEKDKAKTRHATTTSRTVSNITRNMNPFPRLNVRPR